MIFNKEAQQQKNEYIIEISNAINRRGLKTHRQTDTHSEMEKRKPSQNASSKSISKLKSMNIFINYNV